MTPNTQTRVDVFPDPELGTITIHLSQYMELKPAEAYKLASELVQAADSIEAFNKDVEDYFAKRNATVV